jgi:outer membrane protein assembly factor BamC
MKIPFRVSLIVCVISVSGCSTIQSWFPDKEKDYQFTTELPPLVIPSDLVQKPSLPTRTASVEPTISKSIQTELPKKSDAKSIEKTEKLEPVNRPVLADAETELNRNEIQVSLTHENAPTLNLNVPSARAWRIVGKALGRSGIEVTNRHAETGQVHIQIADSKPKSDTEKSLLDESLSVFDGFVSNETAYILQFRETNAKTAVTLLDAQLQPLSDGSDNKVLTTLFDAIKADLSK